MFSLAYATVSEKKWKLSDSRDSESVHVDLMTRNFFSWKDFMFPSALKTKTYAKLRGQT